MARLSKPGWGGRGMTTVEAALVFPLLILMTFGVIEYGWMFVKAHELANVARQAARTAALPSSAGESPDTVVQTMMQQVGMGSAGYVVTYNPPNYASAASGTLVTVSISVPYANIGLLPNLPLWNTPCRAPCRRR